MKLDGQFFDGKTSVRHPVAVEIVGGELVIVGHGINGRAPIGQIDIGECLDGDALTLHLPDGSSCEVANGNALEAMIDRAGRRPPIMVVLQRNAISAMAALVLLIGLVVSGYRWGLPWTAEKLAPRIPQAAVSRLGDLVLRSLDREALKPSTLSVERQRALRAGTDALATTQALPAYKLLFRASPQLGANAFALPGGTIVVLDRLVAQASDEQVIAVVAHELGHVAHHHPMRRLIHDAVISTAVAAYVGDLSAAVASATALVLSASYSRDYELEADRYAAERLLDAGRDPLALVALLEKLDRGTGGASLFSTHPDLAARAAALRRIGSDRQPVVTGPATQ